MRPIPAILGALAAIAIFFLWPSARSVEEPSDEIVKAPSMATIRLASTTTAMSLDYQWKRQGPDAVANFIIENFNTFEVTSFDIVCYLFDKDAKSVGESTHPIQRKLATNLKTSFNGVLFRNVEPSSRRAICTIANAKPWVQF
jgi:hypothetical protein